MHRSEPIISDIYYVSDDDYVFLRVDFFKKRFLLDNPGCRLILVIVNPGQGKMIFSQDGIVSVPSWAGDVGDILHGVDECAEIGIKKKVFFPEGRGEIFFRVAVAEKDTDMEVWPEGDPIRFSFAGQGEEIVWDL